MRALLLLLSLTVAIDETSPIADADTPVLVELFTSEGCNSCPPADAFLHDLTQSPPARSGELILIAWHVDYWDHLGWRDPFGLPSASVRQRQFDQAMQQRGVPGAGIYTPQMIINGQQALVGSNRNAGREAINKAARADIATLQLAVKPDDDKITITTKLPTLPAGVTVVGVLVEDDLRSAVKAGENRGHTLRHDRVARAVAEGKIADGVATIELRQPAGVVAANASLVVFAQAADTGPILAVGAAPLADEPSQTRR